MKALNLTAGLGVAAREYPTDSGPADYVLFVNRQTETGAQESSMTITKEEREVSCVFCIIGVNPFKPVSNEA